MVMLVVVAAILLVVMMIFVVVVSHAHENTYMRWCTHKNILAVVYSHVHTCGGVLT